MVTYSFGGLILLNTRFERANLYKRNDRNNAWFMSREILCGKHNNIIYNIIYNLTH